MKKMLEKILSVLDLMFAKIFWKIVFFNIYKYEEIKQKEGVISTKIKNNLSPAEIGDGLANLFFSKLWERRFNGFFTIINFRCENFGSNYVSVFRNKIEIFRVTIISPNEFTFCLFDTHGSPKGGSRFKNGSIDQLKTDALEIFFDIVAKCKIK